MKWFGIPVNGAARPGTVAPLTAAYWNGAAPAPRNVREIDLNGAFIESAEPWRPGTMLHLALTPQPKGQGGRDKVPTFGLWAVIASSAPDGMAVRFSFESPAERKKFRQFLATLSTESEEMEGKKAAGRGENGQALIECALVLPILILVILNVVNFGAFIYAWVSVANAARAGAQYWCMGGAMVTGPSTPTAPQVTAFVRRELASSLPMALPNWNTAQVRLCTNNPNRTPQIVCVGSGTVTPPPLDRDTDTDTTPYTLGTVDVTYSYRPVVPLAIATLPATTIRSRSAMRIMQ